MNYHLLWADDEIEHLRAHILFLEKKGYDVTTVSNGLDAIDLCRQQTFDLIMLDEMMPGISGLETLQKIKEITPETPIVMITKSEEEHIMDQAVGQKIADYLIKPVNPSQILLSLKKNIHSRSLVNETTQSGYQQNFNDIAMQIADSSSVEDWMNVYRRLVHWELELSSADTSMSEMLKAQKEDANNGFAKFISKNYMAWMEAREAAMTPARPASSLLQKAQMRNQRFAVKAQTPSGKVADMPMMSPDIFKKCVFPLIDNGEKVFLIVIDNFRYDQWRVIARQLAEDFEMDEKIYMSILPTATQYARNAIFSGLMPSQIAKMFPDLWVDEDEEEGKNLNEAPLVETQIERYRRKDSFSYSKINTVQDAEKLLQHYNNLEKNDLNVVVFNFIDMLSHARTESKMVRELANNEDAYRSITLSWFQHSAMSQLFRLLAQDNYKVIVTTDHGSIRATRPVKIIGDRNVNTNLRYKLGKNLNYNKKEVFEILDPRKAHLPQPNVSTAYVFATGDSFFAYPNNYNYYVSYYKDTFQHGGISMEEMLIPLVTLTPKRRQ